MKLKVFLVEDNADARFLLACVLEAAGHEVRVAGTMQAALHDFAQWRGDVLICDIGLPDGSGWELLRELRRRGESPYAIAMSGFGQSDDIAASLDAGFRHHLVKPIEADLLERLIEVARVERDAGSE